MFSQRKPHFVAVEHIRRLHLDHLVVLGLVGVWSAPARLGRFPQLDGQTAVCGQFQLHPVVLDDKVGEVRTGLENPVLFPPWTRGVGAVSRRPRSDAHIDSWPNIAQLEPRFRDEAFRPP